MRLRSIAVVVCAGFLLTFQMLAQVQGTWSTTKGNLLSPLWLNTQVLLTNGNVLVAGGANLTNVLNTAQLYNPTTGLWTATGSMQTARESFAAVALANGQVLVEGGVGSGGAILATAELYTPSTGNWTPAGAMSVARYGHTATLLQNGTVLVTGGCTSASCPPVTGVTELYDPTTNTWTTTTSLNLARTNQTATLLHNGKVLVVGGTTTGSPANSTKSCELYDPTAKTWTTVASTSVPRNQHATALLASGKVLVSGGYYQGGAYSTAEIYDPTANAWTPTGNMTLGRFAHTATTLANRTVLIAAGGTFHGLTYQPTPTTEIYDVVTGTFKATGSLNQWRMSQTASLLKSGRAMVLGGNDYSGLSQTAEIYTPLTLTISPLNLSFGLEQIGVTSAAQTATVTNVSHSAVGFTSISASGDFAQTNTCPSLPLLLAAGASCSISVEFRPTAAGTRNGSVTLKDNSIGNPSQTIALTGTGETYAISFTPPSLALPAVLPGFSTSASATVTNDSSAPVSISTITITPADGTFTQTNNCPSTLGVNQTCTIQVVFTPPDSITYNETLQIIDATGSSYLLTLTGTGLN